MISDWIGKIFSGIKRARALGVPDSANFFLAAKIVLGTPNNNSIKFGVFRKVNNWGRGHKRPVSLPHLHIFLSRVLIFLVVYAAFSLY